MDILENPLNDDKMEQETASDMAPQQSIETKMDVDDIEIPDIVDDAPDSDDLSSEESDSD